MASTRGLRGRNSASHLPLAMPRRCSCYLCWAWPWSSGLRPPRITGCPPTNSTPTSTAPRRLPGTRAPLLTGLSSRRSKSICGCMDRGFRCSSRPCSRLSSRTRSRSWHAMSFLLGLAGLAAVVPMARLTVGHWAGLTALTLCLLTGYLYGNLFFAPIDVPFLFAMSWSTLAIVLMVRQVVPSWRLTLVTGLATGLAIATRTGGGVSPPHLARGLSQHATRELHRNRNTCANPYRLIHLHTLPIHLNAQL